VKPAALAAVLLCAACATTVRDVAAPDSSQALLAGRLAFTGTRIGTSLWLRGPGGREVVVRPENEAFLVAVPPGIYELRRFGAYAIADDRATVEARTGAAVYIGTFHAVRDRYGDAAVRVADEREDVVRRLGARYGDALPPLEPGLVASSLEPLEPGDLVLALRKTPNYYYPYPYRYGFHFGYWRGVHRHPGPRVRRR